MFILNMNCSIILESNLFHVNILPVQEQGIIALQQNIEALSKNSLENEDDRELNELIVENTKLKHRLAILQKVSKIY